MDSGLPSGHWGVARLALLCVVLCHVATAMALESPPPGAPLWDPPTSQRLATLRASLDDLTHTAPHLRGPELLAIAQECTELISKYPERSEPYSLRARARELQGRPLEALADHRASIVWDVQNPEYYARLGMLFVYLEKPAKAVSEFSSLIMVDPDLPFAFPERALNLAMLGDADAAVIDCDKALALSPHLARAYSVRGVAHATAERYDLAIADSNKAIRLAPGDARSFVNRAYVFAAAGFYMSALADAERAVKVESMSAVARCVRADLNRVVSGSLESALRDYTYAIDTVPFYSRAYWGRGLGHHARGQLGAAQADFRSAILLDPEMQAHPEGRTEARRILSECGVSIPPPLE